MTAFLEKCPKCNRRWDTVEKAAKCAEGNHRDAKRDEKWALSRMRTDERPTRAPTNVTLRPTQLRVLQGMLSGPRPYGSGNELSLNSLFKKGLICVTPGGRSVVLTPLGTRVVEAQS